MTFLSKHFHKLVAAALLCAAVATIIILYFEVPVVAVGKPALRVYSCPMHAEVRQKGLGTCPKCGMPLTLANQRQALAEDRCGDNGPSCCSQKRTGVIRLPPGHPPVPGLTTDDNKTEHPS